MMNVGWLIVLPGLAWRCPWVEFIETDHRSAVRISYINN